MVSLIKRFGLHDALRNELYAEHVKTDAYIVDRAREALQVLKQCGSEEQRQHYRVGLTILAPQAAKFGDSLLCRIERTRNSMRHSILA